MSAKCHKQTSPENIAVRRTFSLDVRQSLSSVESALWRIQHRKHAKRWLMASSYLLLHQFRNEGIGISSRPLRHIPGVRWLALTCRALAS